jgi:hypothetical protein
MFLLHPLLLASSMIMGALPVDPAHMIEPVVTRDAYTDFCRNMGIDNDQFMIAELLYEDYLSGLVEVQAASELRAKAAGSQELEAAYEGRSSVSSATLRELRVAILRTRAMNWASADELQSALIDGTIALGVSLDREDATLVINDLRRRVIFDHARRDSAETSYAGDGFDLPGFIELEQTHSLKDVPPEQFDSIVSIWKDRVASIVIRNAALERAGVVDRRVADIQRDVPSMKRLMSERATRWHQLHELTTWAIDSIAAQLDAQTASAWGSRARAEQFPWLYAMDTAEGLGRWIQKNGDTSQQLEVEALLDSYRIERDAVRRNAELLVIQARIEAQVTLGTSASELVPEAQESHRRWLRISGELELLKSKTIDRIESLLTPGQRAAARRSLYE